MSCNVYDEDEEAGVIANTCILAAKSFIKSNKRNPKTLLHLEKNNNQ